jgi:hypothetical protein
MNPLDRSEVDARGNDAGAGCVGRCSLRRLLRGDVIHAVGMMRPGRRHGKIG